MSRKKLSAEQKLANRRKRWALAFELVERGDAHPQVVECVELVKQGLGIPQIVEKLGVSHSTVAQRLKDPTGEKARARKQKKHGSCEDCGRPTYNSGSPPFPKRCISCCRNREKERRDQVIEAWERGDSIEVIAKRVGWSVNTLLSVVGAWREAGYAVSYRQLPHRDTAARYERIAEMVRDARSNAEIAREIGTTPESAGQMVMRMRSLGYKLPYRVRGPKGGVKLVA